MRSMIAWASAQRVQRSLVLPDLSQRGGDFAVGYGDVALQAGIVGIDIGGLFDGDQTLAEGLQSRGCIVLRQLHVADLVERERQVAQPAGIVGRGRRQALDEGEARLVRRQRSGEIVLHFRASPSRL